jgi:hypothetical protein
MVKKLIANALNRMPRKLIHPSASVMTAIVDPRNAPAVMKGQ